MIVAAYRARGVEPPAHLLDPPRIRPEFLAYWEAYQDLVTERRAPRGPIPVTAVVEYARAYGLDPDTLKRIVWKVDQVVRGYWEAQDKAQEDERKRQAEAERQRQSVGAKT